MKIRFGIVLLTLFVADIVSGFKMSINGKGKGPPTQDMKDILDIHNLYRCVHNVPSLIWHDDLAKSAQQWAEQGKFEHSPNELRFIGGVQAGENIAWGYSSGNETVKAWYCEIDCTEPYGLATDASDSKSAEEPIGHYTQVVWANTLYIGCGKGTSFVEGSAGDLWVCQYSEAGNYGGQYETNVLQPTVDMKSCPYSSFHTIASSCPVNDNCPKSSKSLVAPQAVEDQIVDEETDAITTTTTLDDPIDLKFSLKITVVDKTSFMTDPYLTPAVQNSVAELVDEGGLLPTNIGVFVYDHADVDKILVYISVPTYENKMTEVSTIIANVGESGWVTGIQRGLVRQGSKNMIVTLCGCT